MLGYSIAYKLAMARNRFPIERIGGQERSVVDRERSMFGEGQKATDQTKQNWSRIHEGSIDRSSTSCSAAHSLLGSSERS
jgi:hypothetical protein